MLCGKRGIMDSECIITGLAVGYVSLLHLCLAYPQPNKIAAIIINIEYARISQMSVIGSPVCFDTI